MSGEVARIEEGRRDTTPSVFTPPMRQDTDSWVEVMRPLIALAEKVYDTEFVPKGLRGSEAATAAAMLYGREVGLPPMTSLNVIHVVEGRPGLSAEAMRALVYAAGHDLEFTESSGALCSMRARRRGEERWTEVTWTIDMARAAGLMGKSNWKSYPRALLQARCTTEICRMVFSDIIHGFRSIEELEDMASGGTDEAPAAATTKVQRKARPRKRAAAALPVRGDGGQAQAAAAAAPGQPAQLAGPPLPGEAGYEQGGGASDPDSSPASSPTPDTGGDAEPDAAPAREDAPDGGAAEEAPDPASSAAAPEEDGPEDGGQVEEKPPPPRASTRAQHRLIFGLLTDLGVDDVREERLLVASRITSREVGSFNDLSVAEAGHVIDTLGRLPDRAALWALLDRLDAAAPQEES